MYLIDTNVVSETRKGTSANPGVVEFYRRVIEANDAAYLSVVSVGEIRRGVELVRHRGDAGQATRLERWLALVLDEFGDNILPFDADAAQIWGRLRVPHPEHELDKQIAATALVNDLTVVTRNTADFARTGVRLINPFRLEPTGPSAETN
jgi:predicted nucleic acid-binding protein